MQGGTSSAACGRGYRVNKAGTTYTFAHDRRIAVVLVACFGLIGVVIAAVVASPAGPDIGVLGKTGVVAIIIGLATLLCLGLARTGVRVSAGKVVVVQPLRTRTVGIGDIRDVTLETKSNGTSSFWVPRMRLANGDTIWLQGLSCGRVQALRPPASWRLASLDKFRSLIGAGKVQVQADNAPIATANALIGAAPEVATSAADAGDATNGLPAWTEGRHVSPPDGFYADPCGSAGVRYWGGGQWSPLLSADWVQGPITEFPGTVAEPLPAPGGTWLYAAARARKGRNYTAAWTAGMVIVIIVIVGHVASDSRLLYLALLLAFRAFTTSRAWRQWVRLDRAPREQPRCRECGTEAVETMSACAQCGTPVSWQSPVINRPAASVISDDAGGAELPGTAAGADGQVGTEPYAPGRRLPVPAPIRRMLRGYIYLGLGLVLGGVALCMVGGYFDNVDNSYDLRYLYVALALWVFAGVFFAKRIRVSLFLRRPADAASGTVAAHKRGGRTLVLYSPWDGHSSELRVRVAWWAAPETLLPGESVTLYGRPAGVGRLLVTTPDRDRAFVGTGRRQPASTAGGQVMLDAPHQPVGPGVGRYLRWGPPALTSLAFAMLVAATVIATAPSVTGHLTEEQIRTGDCLTGSMGLGTDNTWPTWVAAVPCTQPHEAEVFFAGNAWPASAPFPGHKAIVDSVDQACENAFLNYDGVTVPQSSFTYNTISPLDSPDWASGDRRLVCVAYIPDPSTPAGGSPVKYSIKGSGR
jgi:hypothetical protein